MKITKVVVTVVDDNNKEHEVTIEPCHESYQQYGASKDILWYTVDLAEAITPFFGEDEKESSLDEEE